MKNTKLTARQEAFCFNYVELNNGKQAAIKAGYKETTANVQASQLLTRLNIQEKIAEIKESLQKESIATSQDVLEFFTKVMNGEVKDQFGLDAPLSERIKAGQELAKRTVDWDNRAKGVADATIEIKLDWGTDDA